MLLTNTIQAETVNVTVVNDIVICGSLRGCSVCPSEFAEQAASHAAAKRGPSKHRVFHRGARRVGEAMAAMYSGIAGLWRQSWLPLPTSLQPGSGLAFGFAAGCSAG